MPEALVAMVMTVAVLLALYTVFDASVWVFGATPGQRRGEAGGDATLLTIFGKEGLDFVIDPDGNRRTVATRPPGSRSLGRKSPAPLSAGGAPLRDGGPLVGSAGDIDGDGRALTFEYFDATGNPVASGDEADVYLVHIELEVSADTAAGGKPVGRVLRTAVASRRR